MLIFSMQCQLLPKHIIIFNYIMHIKSMYVKEVIRTVCSYTVLINKSLLLLFVLGEKIKMSIESMKKKSNQNQIK